MGVRELECRKGLEILSLNLNSFLLHIDEIKTLMKEKSIHVLALNETKLDVKKGALNVLSKGEELIDRQLRCRFVCSHQIS